MYACDHVVKASLTDMHGLLETGMPAISITSFCCIYFYVLGVVEVACMVEKEVIINSLTPHPPSALLTPDMGSLKCKLISH